MFPKCVRVSESLSLVNKSLTESRRVLIWVSFTDLGTCSGGRCNGDVDVWMRDIECSALYVNEPRESSLNTAENPDTCFDISRRRRKTPFCFHEKKRETSRTFASITQRDGKRESEQPNSWPDWSEARPPAINRRTSNHRVIAEQSPSNR